MHIASSEFPGYLPYFGDERDPWTAAEGVENRQRVRLGGSTARDRANDALILTKGRWWGSDGGGSLV